MADDSNLIMKIDESGNISASDVKDEEEFSSDDSIKEERTEEDAHLEDLLSFLNENKESESEDDDSDDDDEEEVSSDHQESNDEQKAETEKKKPSKKAERVKRLRAEKSELQKALEQERLKLAEFKAREEEYRRNSEQLNRLLGVDLNTIDNSKNGNYNQNHSNNIDNNFISDRNPSAQQTPYFATNDDIRKMVEKATQDALRKKEVEMEQQYRVKREIEDMNGSWSQHYNRVLNKSKHVSEWLKKYVISDIGTNEKKRKLLKATKNFDYAAEALFGASKETDFDNLDLADQIDLVYKLNRKLIADKNVKTRKSANATLKSTKSTSSRTSNFGDYLTPGIVIR